MTRITLHNWIVRILSRFISSKQIRRKFCDLFIDRRYAMYHNHAHDMGANIGRHSYLGEGCIVYHPDTKIGSFCCIAHNVLIGAGKHPLDFLSVHPFLYKTNTNVNFESYDPVKIGNDVWIGSNVVIMDGVKVGDGAVIGSNAVVTKDVPPYAIAVGVPVKIVRYRFDEEKILKLQEFRWWELEDRYLMKLPSDDVDECIKELSKINSL